MKWSNPFLETYAVGKLSKKLKLKIPIVNLSHFLDSGCEALRAVERKEKFMRLVIPRRNLS